MHGTLLSLDQTKDAFTDPNIDLLRGHRNQTMSESVERERHYQPNMHSSSELHPPKTQASGPGSPEGVVDPS